MAEHSHPVCARDHFLLHERFSSPLSLSDQIDEILSDIVRFLPYNIKHLKKTVVVNLCYLNTLEMKTEKLLITLHEGSTGTAGRQDWKNHWSAGLFQFISNHGVLRLDHLWMIMGMKKAEHEAGPHEHISRWSVIYKGNIVCRCA